MLKQGLSQKLLQKLSPQQIQFIQLLQLNTPELEQRIEEEITENPALENEKGDDAPEIDPQDENAPEIETESHDDDLNFEDDFEDNLNDYIGDDDDYAYNGGNDNPEEKKDVPFATVNTLYDTLIDQLDSTRVNAREKELAKHLIGMIEEDGYLRRPLKNIAYDMAFLNQIQTNETELEKVLRIIQSFDPAGIGARNLEECLMIQLNKKSSKDPVVLLAKKIIQHHLDDLAKKHYDKLVKSLKVDKEKLREAIDMITHLDPKPGESQVNAKTQYIIPDFIVTNNDGELQVILNSKNAPELKVNRSYQETIRGYQESNVKNKALKSQVQFIKQKLDSAKWFIDAIKQRQNTLLYTMRTIVEYQSDFFITGDIEKLNPMILKDIADKIQMDISTVSRVVSSKYVQTEFGIYSLKEFFSEGIQTESGEEVSNREVKQILKDIIGKESKKKPLTDEKLTSMLNGKGYNIARRTVAKYREQLNIPVARLRKEFNYELRIINYELGLMREYGIRIFDCGL